MVRYKARSASPWVEFADLVTGAGWRICQRRWRLKTYAKPEGGPICFVLRVSVICPPSGTPSHTSERKELQRIVYMIDSSALRFC
jgi:hypothetical protein